MIQDQILLSNEIIWMWIDLRWRRREVYLALIKENYMQWNQVVSWNERKKVIDMIFEKINNIPLPTQEEIQQEIEQKKQPIVISTKCEFNWIWPRSQCKYCWQNRFYYDWSDCKQKSF